MWTIKGSRKIEQPIKIAVEKAYQAFLARNDLGFFDKSLVNDVIQKVETQSSFFLNKRKLAVIGVGGSSLGTKALCDALHPGQEKVWFLDNVDSFSVDRWLESIDPNEWGWVMVSKSGSTMEVLGLYDYCHQWIQEKYNLSIVDQTAVVTEDKSSAVNNFAVTNNLPLLSVPFNVGGRFSVMTAVGLFPYSFLDSSLNGFSKGHNLAIRNSNFVKDLVGQLWASHHNLEKVFYSFQYSDRLQSFGLWLQQLWSESLGKKNKADGSLAQPVATIVSCRGAADQHSVLQQVIEGPEKKFVSFHRVKSSEKGQVKIEDSLFEASPMQRGFIGKLLDVEASATEQALGDCGVGTMVLTTEDLNQQSMAFLMMSWMLAIGVLGELLEINAFDQPGVESGKIITRRVLSQVD